MTTTAITQNGHVGQVQPPAAIQPAGRESNKGQQRTRDLKQRIQDRRDRTKDPSSILILHRTTEGGFSQICSSPLTKSFSAFVVVLVTKCRWKPFTLCRFGLKIGWSNVGPSSKVLESGTMRGSGKNLHLISTTEWSWQAGRMRW